MLAVAGLGLVPLAGVAAERFDLRVGLLERVLRHDRAVGEFAVALVGDLHALGQIARSPARNSNLSITLPGSSVGVARRLDPHLAQHLRDDDLDVLVVDFDALAAIDVLNFAQSGTAARLLRREMRRMSCGTSGPSTSASPARTKSPAWTRKCLPCGTRCSRSMPLSLRTMIVRLPRRFSPKQLDRAVDLGDDGRILRLAGFEDFRHARQTAGDVLRARRLRAASWPAAYRPRSCWPSSTSMWALSGR